MRAHDRPRRRYRHLAILGVAAIASLFALAGFGLPAGPPVQLLVDRNPALPAGGAGATRTQAGAPAFASNDGRPLVLRESLRAADSAARGTAVHAAAATSTPATALGTSVGPAAPPPLFTIYTIQAGDTVSTIANEHGLATQTLIDNNPALLNPNMVKPGWQILIPIGDGVLYTVHPGDNLSSIADTFHVAVSAIAGFAPNQLSDPSHIGAGQLLFIPGAHALPPPPKPAPTSAPASPPAAAPATPATPGQPATSPPPPPAANGFPAVVRYAMAEIGATYVWGGTGPQDGGFDCSGLVQWAYRQIGVSVPRTATAQYYATRRISYSELRPGDLVFFAHTDSEQVPITHVGIYIGNGEMVNATGPGDGVRISTFTSGWWKPYLAGYGRVS